MDADGWHAGYVGECGSSLADTKSNRISVNAKTSMARDPQCVRVAGKGTSGSGYGTRFAVPENRLSKTRIVHRALKIETWVAAYPYRTR